MFLSFNGKSLSDAEIREITMNYTPKGKDKTVTFVKANSTPIMQMTERGVPTMRTGGTFPVKAECTTKLNGQTGILRYYETEGEVMQGDKMVSNFEPKYLNFINGSRTIDAGKQKEQLAYFILNRYNEKNANEYGVRPAFKMIDIGASASKVVDSGKLRRAVYELIAAAEKEQGKPRIKSLYAALGGKDYQELKANDWDSIMAPIYSMAESNPAKLKGMLENAGLEKEAEVVEAMDLGVIRRDDKGFYWRNGKPIWKVPAGKQDNMMQLFIEHITMKDSSGIYATIKADVEKEVALREVTST